MKNKLPIPLPFIIIFGTVFLIAIIQLILALTLTPEPGFSGEKALEDISYQFRFGPRLPGSSSHTQTARWINAELRRHAWNVEIQRDHYKGQIVHNVIAKRGEGRPWIILGTHYDTRQWADQDPDPSLRKKPVEGANDGASGVAVLVELGRSLPPTLSKQIWLVFFDAEDQGDIPGWEWIMGSQFFVEQLEDTPDAVIIVDMVGDADLQIYWERNSDPELMREIWDVADQLGHRDSFIPVYRYQLLDDHIPFVEKGIPTALIIDFDYPYWHTTHDTLDKVSTESLQKVGDTLYYWLLEDWQNKQPDVN